MSQWCASFYPVNNKPSVHTLELAHQTIHIGLVRLKRAGDFSWNSLTELKGRSVALLRSQENSAFVSQFKTAGLIPVFVETVQAAIQMVLLNRVDYAMSDEVTFLNLEGENKDDLQFSHSSLFQTPIQLYLNTECVPRPEAILK